MGIPLDCFCLDTGENAAVLVVWGLLFSVISFGSSIVLKFHNMTHG